LKGFITPQEWNQIKNKIRYDFQKDNHFEELKNAEILKERLGILRDIGDYEGRYYSREWIMTNVLQMKEKEIEDMKKVMDKEAKENPPPEDEEGGNSFQR